MIENEISLINRQLESLTAKNFDLEAWKSHTIIFLERIFGKESSKVKMIKELQYDYSSWSLRDAAGTGKDADPVIMKARELLEATKLELEHLGVPKVEDENLNPQEETIKEQKAELIQIFVDKLPPKYQKLVRLRYFQELSYEEIAIELEAPLGTVKAQLHRARELMFEMVKNKRDHI